MLGQNGLHQSSHLPSSRNDLIAFPKLSKPDIYKETPTLTSERYGKLKASSMYFCMKLSVKWYFLCSVTKALLFHSHSEGDYMLPVSLKTALFYLGRYTCHIGALWFRT